MHQNQMTGIDDFRRWAFETEGIRHEVYTRGKGPPVVLMHELPGMTEGCIRTGERIADAGFTVHMPLFFGEPGRSQTMRNLVTVCIQREFNTFTANGASPIAGWLRALCREVSRREGGSGVGVIGMCFTGNVVLSVMLEPAVRVPVLCEPAVPLVFGKSGLGIPDADVNAGLQQPQDGPILAFRFSEDTKCPRERFETLRTTYGSRVHAQEYSSKPDNRFNIPQNAHSVLTNDFPGRENPDHPSERALAEILTNFRLRLGVARECAE